MRYLAFALAFLLAPMAWAQAFQAPNGSLGAGLSTSKEQKGRAYGEMSFFGRNGTNAFPLVLGGGYKVATPLELHLQLPIAIGNTDVPFFGNVGGAAIGNFQLGLNFLTGASSWRLKVGGAFAFGPWTGNDNVDGLTALGTSALVRLEDFSLWSPETVSITTPLRVEFDAGHMLISGDTGFGFYIPTNGSDPIVALNLAPGIAYSSKVFTGGARVLALLFLTDAGLGLGDQAQIAFEPYARFNIGKGFLTSRLTLYLDDPLGFGFDSNGIWALHLGGGGSF